MGRYWALLSKSGKFSQKNWEENKFPTIVHKNAISYFEKSIIIPKIFIFEDSYNLLENKSLCKYSLKDAQNVIDNAINEVNSCLEILRLREIESFEIEKITYETKKSLETIDYSLLPTTIINFINAKQKYEKFIEIKKWPNNSSGKTIDCYNKSMNEICELINFNIEKISIMFNSDIKRITDGLNYINRFNLKETDFPERDDKKYKNSLYTISKYYSMIDTLNFVNKKMNLESEKLLEEMSIQLEKTKIDIENLKKVIPSRILKKLNENKQIIININNERKKIEENFLDDNSHLSELGFDYLEDKCSYVISKYGDLKCSKAWLNKYNEKYNFNVGIPDTTVTLNSFRDLIILYQSTFLLKPHSNNLREVFGKVKNSLLSLAAAFIYVNEFTNWQCSFHIENEISNTKKEIESIIFTDSSFANNITMKIQSDFSNTYAIIYDILIKLEIFADALKYIPNYDYSSIKSIMLILKSRNDSYRIMKNLKKMVRSSFSSTLVDIADLYIPIIEERQKHFIIGDPSIYIDLGSYNTRSCFKINNYIKENKKDEEKQKEFIELLAEIINRMLGYKNISKVHAKIFEVLDKYKKQLNELLDYPFEKVSVFITSHKIGSSLDDIEDEILKRYDFVENVAIIDP